MKDVYEDMEEAKKEFGILAKTLLSASEFIEKNKEIETERRKSVHEFLSKEMDIDRLKQEIIERSNLTGI